MITNARLRLAVFAAAGVQTLFWLYTFRAPRKIEFTAYQKQHRRERQ